MSTSTINNAATSGTSSTAFTYTPTKSSSTASSASASSNTTTDAATSQDRFLKLLVAQLNNQDPMNPMDNAQMTSQIAQINTVTGINQLNTTVSGLTAQFSAMQGMQAAALVGRSVQTAGNTLAVDAATKKGSGSFELSGAASHVVVDIATEGGVSLGSINLGAQAAGTHDFTWDASAYSGAGALKFTVSATNAGKAVTSTALQKGTVAAVGADSAGTLNLTLGDGSTVAYSKVKSIR